MAINTPKPISRDERYLSKIGGNEEVIVPKPISREEKYMYRAAGYDDQPIPDYPIGRNEKYWAKIIENGGGSGNGSTVTFDSGQKFISDNSSLKDYKIYGNGGEIHPTGVLPLTFTAKSGTADDWTIYGNDDNGTENEFDKNQTITEGLYLLPSGNTSAESIWGISDYMPVQPNTTYTLCKCKGYTPAYVWYDSAKTYIRGTSYSNHATNTETSPANAAYLKVSLMIGDQSNIDTFMLVKGSTAPDHYIPHQQGVGERTENLFDKDSVIQNYFMSMNGAVSSTAGAYSDYIPVQPNASYYITRGIKLSTFYTACAYDSAKTFISYCNLNNTDGAITTPSNCAYVIINVLKTNLDAVMFTAGSTAPSSYIPYGYQIPISCEHTISDGISYNEDKLLYFDGSVVSQPPYQTTSDFIAVTQKEITISGTSPSSTNKLVRLCGYDENKTFLEKQDSSLYGATEYSFTFALGSQVKYIKYSLYKTDINIIAKESNDYTLYIGDSPLTEGETVSKTSTGVDIELFEGENTVSTTLYNKPAMEIETSYGVGVKDNNHYIIPFKVNTTIYNIQIGDSPLYDGEYLSYKEKKLYKYIDSVLTPIDPPSPFPEISTTEGVNKVIIETSTQPDSIFITTQNPIKLVQPNIGTKTITQNGIYNASDDNLDGYSSVTVNTN